MNEKKVYLIFVFVIVSILAAGGLFYTFEYRKIMEDMDVLEPSLVLIALGDYNDGMNLCYQNAHYDNIKALCYLNYIARKVSNNETVTSEICERTPKLNRVFPFKSVEDTENMLSIAEEACIKIADKGI